MLIWLIFRPLPTTTTPVTVEASALLRKRARSPRGDSTESTISPEVKRRSKELENPATTTANPTANPNVIFYNYL